jgi:membrane protein implicated in regulation of membrane protease activity
MLWWQWVIGGLLLLAAELGFVVADFYLVFIGLAAALVGALMFVGLPLSAAQQWLVFAVGAVVSLGLFRAKVYRYLRPETTVSQHGLMGEVFVLPVDCPAHVSVNVEVRGAFWPVTHKREFTFKAGSLVEVKGLEGLTLIVDSKE